MAFMNYQCMECYEEFTDKSRDGMICIFCNGPVVTRGFVVGYPRVTKKPSRPVTEKTRCNHRYTLIDSEVREMYTDDEIYLTNVNALFYCEKCLEIKRIVKDIDN